jgi:hypothetical protein
MGGETRGERRQTVFIDSVELRRSYLKPFGMRHYWQFKKDPRWPAPVIGKGGKEVYRRADIDQFLERIAREGFDFQ